LSASPEAAIPNDFLRAWWAWGQSLSKSPTRQQSLLQSISTRMLDTWNFSLQAATCTILPHENPDPRFADPLWNHWPFNVYARSYGHMVSWWSDALFDKQGLTRDEILRLEFSVRQMLAVISPAHYLSTNPELIEQTRTESGANLVRGAVHWMEDAERMLRQTPVPGTEHFRVGETVAATPGKVVLQNELIELIQYTPQTTTVCAEPILITPAWIMKYYILDLSARNSLVRYLVEQGHTVFMISWKNPERRDSSLSLDDYVRLGLRAALDAVTTIVPNLPVHTVGYCIGGTLLSIGAAALARAGDTRIGSMTLLAAQTDFSEPGELSVFISPSQLSMLETMMNRQGVLQSDQMGMAFGLLRSADLLWTPAVNTYLRGKRDSINDLMSWNADGTRMPSRMHSEYLTRLYLRNELAGGAFTVEGQAVDLHALTVPMFVVGTETDHVAPWRSVYKVRGLTQSSDYTFLLTSGGHNAGIISGPVHPKRSHRTLHLSDATTQVSADAYLDTATLHPGSWWPTWQQWLAEHSSERRVAPPVMGNAAGGYSILRDAPGEYIRG
jgi:polyhydroxyalkanoate synthase